MSYQLLINDTSILSGNVFVAAIIAVIILAVLALVAEYIWKRLRENDVLKYEFITIIAHKFRTPLTSIKWLIEGFLGDSLDARLREGLTDVKQSTDKLISMTGTLIELTDTDNESRSSYSFEKVTLCDLVRGVSNAMLNRFHEKNQTFSMRCEAEDVVANVDRVRLEFVLQTLLENASTYTPTGRQVEVTVSRSGRKAAITVADNGIGIDPKDMPHIFSKFYRAANARAADTEGFGVGLYLARSVIRRHHGKMEVYSAGLDQGTAFTVTIPIVH